MIILASGSKWRAKLLHEWGFDFRVRSTDVDEETEKNSIPDPRELVQVLAAKKAAACLPLEPNETILAADTIVFFQDQVIGKPTDRQDAKRIIQLLSGHTHQVWTGICLLNPNHQFTDVASVTFLPMTDTEIETYLDSNDWIGKAGAYQVQKAIKPFVEKIDGDINTVIGLPQKLISQLKKINL